MSWSYQLSTGEVSVATRPEGGRALGRTSLKRSDEVQLPMPAGEDGGLSVLYIVGNCHYPIQ